VLAARVGEVAGRIVVVEGDVGGQSRARVAPLDQIVRQERVLGEAAARGLLEHVHVVNPLSGEAPLAVQVLVDVRDRGGVWVDARVARMDGREDRGVRAGQGHAHPRLQNAVAADHAPRTGVVDGAVEGVGQCPDQKWGGSGWEDRVRVERDHEADLAERLDVPGDLTEGVLRTAPQEVVELGELSSLSLPAHPNALTHVPAAWAVQQVEAAVVPATVALVERAHAFDGSRDEGFVFGARLDRGVREVAQHREVQVRLAVGEELHLEVVERLAHGIHVREERGDHDGGSIFGGDTALNLQVELGKDARRQVGRDELVHDRYGDVEGGQDADRRQDQPSRPGTLPREPEERAERDGGTREDSAAEEEVRMPQHESVGGRRQARPVPGGDFQIGEPVVHEVVAHVCVEGGALWIECPAPRELDRLKRDRLLVSSGSPGQVLDHVAVPVARAERHPGVVARGVAPERGFHHALALDERLPVHVRDGA
jgi:hypothetical protein